MAPIARLVNPVQTYAWGSRSALAEFLGTPPSPVPQAELWMGAHALAPSSVVRQGRSVPLTAAIERDPEAELGDRVRRRFGPRLPFLLKVIAADRPLSLQAHPDAEQAARGFAAETARGLHVDDPKRNYKDPFHKPEIVCALGPFVALCGFRPIAEVVDLFERLAAKELTGVLAPLLQRRDDSGLKLAFEALMQSDAETQAALAAGVVRAARQKRAALPEYATALDWLDAIAARYPRDVGVVACLLLNLVELQAGEALFLPAGNLHCYLSGIAVEVMASSDNVLRGGLTSKHVDVPELLSILKIAAERPVKLLPRAGAGSELVYETPAAEFRLSRIHLQEQLWSTDVCGPEIVLVTAGSAELCAQGSSEHLVQGESAFVAGSAGAYTLRGAGVVHRVSVGET